MNNSEDNTTKNKMQKSTKIMIAIIAILAVIIGGLIFFILTSKDSDKNDGDITTESVEDVIEDEGADLTEEPATEEDSDSIEYLCYAEVKMSNSWESGDKYSAQFDVTIYNNDNSSIKDWSVELTASAGTTVDNSWNSECEINGTTITIKPVQYNSEVAASSSASDIGFIVTTSNKSDIDNIPTSVKLYVGGELYSTVAKEEPEAEEEEEEDDNKGNNAIETPPSSEIKHEAGTPLDNHGKLSVDGVNIVDESGDKYQLKGVSTHGIAWFPDYVNKDGFETFRDDWGANLIRIAMYTGEYDGYCNGGDKEYLKGLVDTGVTAATELGMYVIIDWHILSDNNPQINKEDAKLFFEEMSLKYKDYDNVIYEICNEPNGGTNWSDIKSYAEEIIPIIRENAPDAIIIVGTPNWSQDVDIASNDPITGYDNIMYAIHFYAATHTDGIRSKVTTALDNGLPVFVSEFSICDASGNGSIDYDQADKWFELIDSNNLSYAGWNISNKDETSSLILPSSNKTSGWLESELSETGVWLRNQILGK